MILNDLSLYFWILKNPQCIGVKQVIGLLISKNPKDLKVLNAEDNVLSCKCNPRKLKSFGIILDHIFELDIYPINSKKPNLWGVDVYFSKTIKEFNFLIQSEN